MKKAHLRMDDTPKKQAVCETIKHGHRFSHFQARDFDAQQAVCMHVPPQEPSNKNLFPLCLWKIKLQISLKKSNPIKTKQDLENFHLESFNWHVLHRYAIFPLAHTLLHCCSPLARSSSMCDAKSSLPHMEKLRSLKPFSALSSSIHIGSPEIIVDWTNSSPAHSLANF